MKQITTLILSVWSLAAVGQTIQNRGFENWITDSTECPTDFECSNQEIFTANLNFEPVKKITAAHSGNFAIQLETFLTAQDTFFGFFIKGDVDNQSGGFAYNQRPDSLVGYAHYNIMPGDTALILAAFSRSGIPMANCIGTFVGTQANYGRFSFPINWQGPSGIMPDSLIFAAASSNAINELGIAQGSKLVLDDVGFVGAAGIAQPPNGGFENWTSIQSERPANWSTFQDNGFAYQYNLVNKLTAPSEVNSGNAAIEIKTNIIDGDTLMGYLNNFKDPNSGGYAYTKQIDTLSGYYQFQTPGTDSGTAMVTLISGTQQYHRGVRLPPVANYTEFNLPFNCPFTPDSIRISFIAGRDFNSVVPGSALWLDDIDFKVCDLPTRPSGFSGVTELCNTIGSTVYGVQMQNDADNYTWSLPPGFSITSTPIDSNVIEVAIDPAVAGSGPLEVWGNVYCGSGPLESFQIEVDTTPMKPVITGHSTLDAGVVGDKYLWFIDGVLSVTDTTKVLDPPSQEQVNYTVVVVNGDCASDTSDKNYHSPGNVQENKKSENISVFPNPTNGLITIQFNALPQEYAVKVFSLVGKLELETVNSSEIDLSNLPSGVYTLQVLVDEQVMNQRIIKL